MEGDPTRGVGEILLTVFQSTPSVWRATMHGGAQRRFRADFNPRPPCGGRLHSYKAVTNSSDFNPRPPCGGRRQRGQKRKREKRISIHALRVEGDEEQEYQASHQRYFNPRPPCGGRPKIIRAPVRFTRISIHALRVEGDSKIIRAPVRFTRISIHALRVEGDGVEKIENAGSDISIHALRVEGDINTQILRPLTVIFQSTPSVWRATFNTT